MAIHSPSSGSNFIASTAVVFAGSAVDPSGGELPDRALAWSSSVDGPLGTGESFSRSDLSPGTHTVRLVAMNARGLADTATVTVIIAPNQAPAAVITSPGPGSSFSESAAVTFSGSASDEEDGPLTGALLEWTSSVDGRIGTGDSFTRDDLSAGPHVIRMVATDGLGAVDTAAVDITIMPNQLPAASIVSPSPGSTHADATAVAFAGTATDPEDGALTGGALVWISSRDGQIGTGTSFERSDLSTGTHAIHLVATDATGAVDTASVSIAVAANQAPAVAITAPSPGATFTEGAAIAFSGSASDPEDGALTVAALVWTSGRDGPLGSGPSLSRSDLSTGTHAIRLVAVDSRGAADTAVVSITVEPPAEPPAPPPNQPPAVAITSPTAGSSHSHGAEVAFSGSASDPEDGALAGAALVWTSSLDGQLGTGGSLSRDDLSTGTHTIRLAATDSHGDSAAATISITVQPPPDTTPPELLGFSFSPDSLDVTDNSGTILFSVDAQDTGSKVARIQLRLVSPSGDQRVVGGRRAASACGCGCGTTTG
ncbi:MAG TPA: hypothetical protein VHG09_02335 [Longimicrobiales bacterium]|nr:hypothetical protein [Longimicrobiales bacterium]